MFCRVGARWYGCGKVPGVGWRGGERAVVVWPGVIWRRIRDAREFTVTAEHLTLLRHAWVSWSEAEFGAPEINPKRPYGNSYVERDIAEILEAPDEAWVDGRRGGFVTEEAAERFTRLHVETAFALQIVLATGEFRPGRYRRSRYPAVDWRFVGD